MLCFRLPVHTTTFILVWLNGFLIIFKMIFISNFSMIIFYSYMRLEPVAPFLLSPRLIVEPKRVIAAQSDLT